MLSVTVYLNFYRTYDRYYMYEPLCQGHIPLRTQSQYFPVVFSVAGLGYKIIQHLVQFMEIRLEHAGFVHAPALKMFGIRPNKHARLQDQVNFTDS